MKNIFVLQDIRNKRTSYG